MRDLHLSYEEIGNLTYPQVHIFIKCIEESNEGSKRETEKMKAQNAMQAIRRGRP